MIRRYLIITVIKKQSIHVTYAADKAWVNKPRL